MSNSSLVTYTNITADRNSPRNHKIDTITIHCVVGGNTTAKQTVDYFKTSNRQVSSNYVVGYDGSIGLSVPESDRAWTSSNRYNDHRAITIEVASGLKSPYAVTDKAYNALINLVTDVCKRNGIKNLVWSNNKSDRVNHKNGCNMTVHRDFANTDCPGEYLYTHMADIASKVNAKLGATSTPATPAPKVTIDVPSASIKGANETRAYLAKGDRNSAVYAYKQLLILLKKAGIITQGVDNNHIFGNGTEIATKQVQKAAGIKEDGYAGVKTIRACYVLLAKKL